MTARMWRRLRMPDGVHVGQDDLGVEQAREMMGAGKWVGVSTHNAEQFRAALRKLPRTTLRWGRFLRLASKSES